MHAGLTYESVFEAAHTPSPCRITCYHGKTYFFRDNRPSNLLALEYSSSSLSLESRQISRSTGSLIFERQPPPFPTLYEFEGDQGSYLRPLSKSSSSMAGGVTENVGGRDIRTLLRRVGGCVLFVARVVEPVDRDN